MSMKHFTYILHTYISFVRERIWQILRRLCTRVYSMFEVVLLPNIYLIFKIFIALSASF